MVAFLRSEGVAVTEGAKPVDSAEANEVYTLLLRAATGSHYDDTAYAAAQARSATYAPDDQSYAARHFRGNTYSHLQWVRMDERRERLRRLHVNGIVQRHERLQWRVAGDPTRAARASSLAVARPDAIVRGRSTDDPYHRCSPRAAVTTWRTLAHPRRQHR